MTTGVVGDAVAVGEFGRDQRPAGQRLEFGVAVEGIDQPSGELRCLGMLCECRQRIRLTLERGPHSFGEQDAHPDRHRGHTGSSEIDGHVGGHLVHAGFLRAIRRAVHVAHRTG